MQLIKLGCHKYNVKYKVLENEDFTNRLFQKPQFQLVCLQLKKINLQNPKAFLWWNMLAYGASSVSLPIFLIDCFLSLKKNASVYLQSVMCIHLYIKLETWRFYFRFITPIKNQPRIYVLEQIGRPRKPLSAKKSQKGSLSDSFWRNKCAITIFDQKNAF
ncbi:hypothetical protein EDC96DRAFT_586530 [Choanephora cucurbitarum]|nr:hypothetical protein EDC96DRAFT_586530 [Choanephora cucurbitarum]